jgi:acetyl-CoA C-acetyltransferase
MEPLSDVVVLGAARTPLGSFQGSLSSVPAPRLGAVAIRAALERARMTADTVTDVFMGTVLQAGQGQAPARQAALHAGLPASARTVTVHKVCGSGMQAVIHAAQALQLDMASVAVAGGMENMSLAPYLVPGAREGYRLGHQRVIDSLVADGLWDPYNDQHMGSCAEQCAARYGFTRAQQDAYAVASFERANAAQQAGLFTQEIAGVAVPVLRGEARAIDQDEGPAKVRYDKIGSLRPAFDPAGTITAANASTLNDGAAALVLSTARRAAGLGITPVARIVAYGGHAQEPVWFTTAPVEATRRALALAGWVPSDVDLWEVNEAFAVVPLAFMAEIGLSHDIVNVRGGAISLGHPIGCSGARILVTLIAALRERELKRGVAAICIGGGEGLAVCVELIGR